MTSPNDKPVGDGGPAKVRRHFMRYTSAERADRAASHRLGHRQRQAVGAYFWTNDDAPGIAFRTRKAAMLAARTQP